MQKTHSGTSEDTLWLINTGGEEGRGSARVSGVLMRNGPSSDDRINVLEPLTPRMCASTFFPPVCPLEIAHIAIVASHLRGRTFSGSELPCISLEDLRLCIHPGTLHI